VDISEPIAEIEDIGLPSIIEVLQEGIGVDRAKRRSALTTGMQNTRPKDFNARFESLSYQHRMHDDIASFSRDNIYHLQALQNSNTIQIRNVNLGGDFGPYRGSRMWAHVEGSEKGGINEAEIRVIRGALSDFIAWVKRKGPPARSLPKVWEIACLCFYVKQEGAIAEMLRDLTGDTRKTRFNIRGAPIEIVCGTVDRFQGREADLVFLSMRNTRRVGFLDSPNRLNVALTRARQQLFIVGNNHYFADCGISELKTLAKETHLVTDDDIRRWRRRNP